MWGKRSELHHPHTSSSSSGIKSSLSSSSSSSSSSSYTRHPHPFPPNPPQNRGSGVGGSGASIRRRRLTSALLAYLPRLLAILAVVLLVQCADADAKHATVAPPRSHNALHQLLYGVNASSSVSSEPPSPPAPDQCLVLHSNVSREICSQQIKQRNATMRGLRLKFCDSFKVYNAINSSCVQALSSSEDTCTNCFRDLERLDQQAYTTFCQFRQIMRQFDCDTAYSTHGSCKLCEQAYKQWLCSQIIPYHPVAGSASPVPPCNSYCHAVEKRCPYFLPELNSQYAGEPSFLCIDSALRSSMGKPHHPEYEYTSAEEASLSLTSASPSSPHHQNGRCFASCANLSSSSSDICEKIHQSTATTTTTTQSPSSSATTTISSPSSSSSSSSITDNHNASSSSSAASLLNLSSRYWSSLYSSSLSSITSSPSLPSSPPSSLSLWTRVLLLPLLHKQCYHVLLYCVVSQLVTHWLCRRTLCQRTRGPSLSLSPTAALVYTSQGLT